MFHDGYEGLSVRAIGEHWGYLVKTKRSASTCIPHTISEATKSTMNSSLYQSLFQLNLRPDVKITPGLIWVMQQDNGTKHRNKLKGWKRKDSGCWNSPVKVQQESDLLFMTLVTLKSKCKIAVFGLYQPDLVKCQWVNKMCLTVNGYFRACTWALSFSVQWRLRWECKCLDPNQFVQIKFRLRALLGQHSPKPIRSLVRTWLMLMSPAEHSLQFIC